MERLPKRRLNTDLRMEVSLVLDDVRINFNDLKDLTVSLVSDKAGIRVGRCQFSVSADGYSLHVKSPADNQRYLGPHRLVLVCAIGDDRATYDRPVVDLVATTAEVDSDSTLADSQGVHDMDIPLSVTELNSSLIVGLLEETEAARDAANAAADKALKVIEPLEGKELQEKLVSGENIKTVNGQSLLGEGDIEIEGGGSSYDDTEIRQELTELSEEVGKKQDTITDLETIRSGASKGATAIQEVKTINGQSIVGSGNIEIQGGGGGASTDKQGVVSQLQQWSLQNGVYSYTMRNVVRGSIPQANIDLFTRIGAVFNEESGYFEMNSLTDISYEEMMNIYTYGNVPTLPNIEQYKCIKEIRTAILVRVNTYYNQNMIAAFQHATLESLYFSNESSPVNAEGLCSNTKYFHTLVIPDYSRGKKFRSNLSQLRVCQIAKINANIELPISKLLPNESILYMIQNEAATSAIVISLHADAYARAMADTEIQSALEAHPNVSLASE